MWPNPQFPADLVTFAEEIPNGKLHFLRSVLALGIIEPKLHKQPPKKPLCEQPSNTDFFI